MRGASDVTMSNPCYYTMKVNSPSCPCWKTAPFRNLCAKHGPPLNICLFASSIASLCAREGIAHVCERVQMRFLHRSQVPARTSLCLHRSFSPSSSEESVPVRREMFVSSETGSLTTAAKRLFHRGHVCRSGCRLSSVRCMVCGMLVVRAPEQGPTLFLHAYTSLLIS